MTCSKVKTETTAKIISKAMTICSHGHMLLHEPPDNATAEALTAAMMTGLTTGKKSIGSSISRALVLTDMAENSVPTDTKPIVASTTTSTNCGRNTKSHGTEATRGYKLPR